MSNWFRCIICADRCPPSSNISTWWQRLLPLMSVQANAPLSAQLCANCQLGIQQLFNVQAEVERLQQEVRSMVNNIRNKVTESQRRFLATNVDDVYFREKLLDSNVAEYSNQQTFFSTINQNLPTLVPVEQLSFSYEVPITRSATSETPLRFNLDVNTDPQEFEIGLGNNEDDGDYAEKNSDAESEEETPPEPGPSKKQSPPSRKRKGKQKVKEDGNATVKKSRVNPPVFFFAKHVKISENKWTFEGHEIIKLDTGFYKCGTCGWQEAWNNLNWMKVRAMKTHIYGVHLGKYNCDICNQPFKSDISLKLHKRHLHPQIAENGKEIGKVACDICQKVMRKSHLKYHMIFIHKTDEEKEALYAAGKVPKCYIPLKFTCKFCQNEYKVSGASGISHNSHEMSCMKNPNRQMTLKSICPICQKPLSKINQMVEHLWTHKNTQERQEAKDRGEMPKMAKLSENKAQCTICKKFVWPLYLKNHMNIHKEMKEKILFNCEYPNCKVVVANKATLKRHVLSVHTPEKHTEWLKCTEPECSEKQFYDVHKLQCHYSVCHKPRKDRKFVCSICNAKFAFNTIYKHHMKKIHSNHPDKLFKYLCPEPTCAQKLRSEDLRKGHITKFHPEIAKKRSVVLKPSRFSPCSICKCPSTAQGLVTHSWIHKNVDEICGALNSGKTIPSYLFKLGKLDHIARLHPSIFCIHCGEKDLEEVLTLQEHVRVSHPDVHKLICIRNPGKIVLERIGFDVSDEGLSVLRIGGKVIAELNPAELEWSLT